MYFQGIWKSKPFILSYTWSCVGAPPDTPQNFRGSCCNIQFKPDAAYKMELFMTINRKQLETVVDCCYKELRLICDSRTNRYIQVQTTKYSVQHLHAQSPHKKTLEMCQIYSNLTIKTPERLLLLLLTLNIFRTLFYCYQC